jgi:hypothetical protein
VNAALAGNTRVLTSTQKDEVKEGAGVIQDAGTPEGSQNGAPNGTRTRVSALRGPRPRPLDDGSAS